MFIPAYDRFALRIRDLDALDLSLLVAVTQSQVIGIYASIFFTAQLDYLIS